MKRMKTSRIYQNLVDEGEAEEEAEDRHVVVATEADEEDEVAAWNTHREHQLIMSHS